VFAHLKFGGTHQVAHVLHPQHIEAGGIEALAQQLEAATHHGRIEVTGPTGGDRHHRYAHGFQAFGIEQGGHVALQHRHRQLAREGSQAAFQKRGFARARAAHHVQAEQSPFVEVFAVVVSLVLIGGQ
jgi:hypothetical protein